MSIKLTKIRPLTDDEEAEIQMQIANDPESLELTKEELNQARPFKEMFPELAAKMEAEIAKRGRPKQEKTKTIITVRLDPEVVDKYRAKGKGWQSQMNQDLRRAVGL